MYHWWLNQTQTNGYAYAKDVFSSDEISKIKEIGNDSNIAIKQEAVAGDQKDIEYRNCNLSFIKSDTEKTEWLFRKLTDIVTQLNQQYFNYDLDYIQNLQFTEYFEGAKYGKHTDLQVFSERPRKLSFIVQLSDPSLYEGGELKIYYSDDPYIADKTLGTLTLFPSYAMHEVTPIISGQRYSLVGWVSGPPFR